MSERELLKEKWIAAGQGHVFKDLQSLSDAEVESFWTQIKEIDVEQLNSVFTKVKKEVEDKEALLKAKAAAGAVGNGVAIDEPVIEPIETLKLSNASETEKQRWEQLGYNALAAGEVVILLIAGGQGTRLGSTDPKGMFDVGLLSKKSLFQIQAERIIKLQFLIKQKTGTDIQIKWYIMTSDGAVDSRTQQFFHLKNNFGLKKEQIFFFQQGVLPAITPDGNIIMETKSTISLSPNGNGELWRTLKNKAILNDWERSGVKWVWSYCVDNILVKIGDPVFLGFTIEKQLEICSKVVPKLYPEERVGVLALKNSRYTVLEYSEIDDKKRYERSSNGDLTYNASHLVINIFSLDFVKRTCSAQLPYHIAKKDIPSIDSTVPGWKLELFIFDIFEFAKKMIAFETLREDDFSPLKNSMNAPTDNPKTCRDHLSRLHKKWLQNAGATIIENQHGSAEELIEVSPLLSYAGEGLEELVKGKSFKLPLYLN